MAEAEIYPALTELFHELFADDSIVIGPQTSAKDIDGWDSFVHLNLIVAVETRFNIKFRTDEIEKLADVGALVSAIESKRHG